MHRPVALLISLMLVAGVSAQKPPQAPPKPDAVKAEDDQVIRVDVGLVNVFFSVRDKQGAYIPDLPQTDFEVFEDGKKVDIKFFSRETDLPLTLGLMVDVSLSQEALIEEERAASYRFFQKLIRPKDLAFVMSFGADVELLQDLTSSLPLLRQGLQGIRLNAAAAPRVTPGTIPTQGGIRGTALYDAVWLGCKEELAREVGRKALILLTDGVDTGSKIKIEEAVRESQKADAIIYPILFEDPQYAGGMYSMGPSGEGPMRKLAEETGGRVFRVDRRNSLDSVYEAISQALRSQYTVGFPPGDTAKSGAFHKLEIRVKGKDYKVQARKGYYSGGQNE